LAIAIRLVIIAQRLTPPFKFLHLSRSGLSVPGAACADFHSDLDASHDRRRINADAHRDCPARTH
jgi:hypothetical protein